MFDNDTCKQDQKKLSGNNLAARNKHIPSVAIDLLSPVSVTSLLSNHAV